MACRQGRSCKSTYLGAYCAGRSQQGPDGGMEDPEVKVTTLVQGLRHASWLAMKQYFRKGILNVASTLTPATMILEHQSNSAKRDFSKVQTSPRPGPPMVIYLKKRLFIQSNNVWRCLSYSLVYDGRTFRDVPSAVDLSIHINRAGAILITPAEEAINVPCLPCGVQQAGMCPWPVCSRRRMEALRLMGRSPDNKR